MWQEKMNYGLVALTKDDYAWVTECLRVVESELFIDNLLVRVHFINVVIRWTGLVPWEFEYPFPGSLISTFLNGRTR